MRTLIFCQQPLLFFALCVGTSSRTHAQQVPLSTTLLELQHSPSPYECAILSAHVYKKDLQAGDSALWIDPDTQQSHPLRGWTVLKVFSDEEEGDLLSTAFQQLGLPYGYRGALYVHAQKKQLVLAHRGTELKNFSSIKTDARSIAQNIIGGQERILPVLLEEALATAQQKQYALSITGHFLGGWLAQVTAFIAKKQYPEAHVKAITFDSPGARPMLEQINARINPTPLGMLDITNYLSSPNLINACNPHVGTVYRVVFERFSRKHSRYVLQSHDMANLVRAFDPQTGDAYRCVCVKDWPLVSKKALHLGKELLAGSKLSAILALCELVKKWGNQELLGEYSGFFRFAKKLNRYHPKPFAKQGKDSFDLTYKYHYNTQPCDPKRLHIRHFPEPAQQFLRNLHKGNPTHTALVAHDRVLQALTWNQQTGYVDDPLAKDLRLVCDQVLRLVRANPEQTTGATPEFTGLLAPPAVSFFVGREAVLKQYHKYFQRPQALLIAPPITGPGGIGKTQLALRILKKQAQQAHYDHVFWLPAESEVRLIKAYLRMAEGVGVYIDKKDIPQTIHRVRLHLKDRRCLYVFDDAPSLQAIQGYLPLQQGHVLITSRNGKGIDWNEEVLPLYLQPFEEREALLLAKRFGYGQGETEVAVLKTLLKQVPCYPLTLVQLFSTLKDEGYTAATFLTSLKTYGATQQEQELIKLLSAPPYARVGYAQSMVYVLKTSLEKLSREAQGAEALVLLRKLAYLDHQGIPVAWVLTWSKEGGTSLKCPIRAALSLLEQYSLVQWDRKAQTIQIHAETQLMVRHLRPYKVLKDLVGSLVAYAGDWEAAHERWQAWDCVLQHGTRLVRYLQKEQDRAPLNRLTRALGKACDVACLYKEALSWRQKNLELAEQHADQIALTESLNHLAVTYRILGQARKALPLHQRALAIREARLGKNHPLAATSLNNLAETYLDLGEGLNALSTEKKALAIRKSRLSKDHPLLAMSLNNLGRIYHALGKDHKALLLHKKELAIRESHLDKNHPLIAYSLNNLATIYRDLGQAPKALPLHERALSILEFRLGKNHPLVARILNNLAATYRILGKYKKALPLHKKALAIREDRLGKDHPHVAWSLNSLAKTYYALGQAQKALSLLERALVIREPRLGKGHSLVACSLDNLAKTYRALGQAPKALPLHKRALSIFKSRLGKDHPDVAYSLNGLAQTHRALGQAEKALPLYKKALTIFESRLGKEHINVVNTLNYLAETYRALGQVDKALPFEKRALEIKQSSQRQDAP